MTKKERVLRACEVLERIYPEALCALHYQEPYQLLIAVRLSAQCTDARVNVVVQDLYARYPDIAALAAATPEEIEAIVKPCGLAEQLLTKYHGVVPDTMEELLTLSGVGRKTANLILGDVYGKPAIVADTHFIRITGRLGLTNSKDPVQVERDLRPLVPPERSSDFCHRIVWFGRDTCRARKPQCNGCPMSGFCPSFPEN